MSPDILTAGAFSVVPTPATIKLARHMLAAQDELGADAVLRWLPDVHPEQVPALIGVLLKAARTGTMPPLPMRGRPTTIDRYTREERLEGYMAHRHGDRDPETVAKAREYRRVARRNERAGKAS